MGHRPSAGKTEWSPSHPGAHRHATARKPSPSGKGADPGTAAQLVGTADPRPTYLPPQAHCSTAAPADTARRLAWQRANNVPRDTPTAESRPWRQSEWRKQPENKKNEHVGARRHAAPSYALTSSAPATAPHLDDLGRQPLFQQLAQTIFRPRGTSRRYVGTPTSESQQRRLNVERRLAVLAKTACRTRWLAVDRRCADTPTSEPQQRRLDVERRLAVPAKTACRTRWLAVDRRRR